MEDGGAGTFDNDGGGVTLRLVVVVVVVAIVGAGGGTVGGGGTDGTLNLNGCSVDGCSGGSGIVSV